MRTLAAQAPLRTHRSPSRDVFMVLTAFDVLGALLVIVLSPGVEAGTALLIASASAVGVVAAAACARSIDARSAAARAVWLARVFGLIGAAIAILFPAILVGEFAFVAPGDAEGYAMLAGEIRFTALTLPLAVVPIVVALRMPVAGGVLVLLSAAWGFVQGAFDPFGAFPERAVTASIVMNTVPPLAIGLALVVGGLAMRRAPKEPRSDEWLRGLFRPNA